MKKCFVCGKRLLPLCKCFEHNVRKKKLEKAVKLCRECHAIRPEERIRRIDSRILENLERARYYFDRRKYKEALEYYDLVLDLDPFNEEALRRNEAIFYKFYEKELRKGKHSSKKLEELKEECVYFDGRLLEAFPKDPKVWRFVADRAHCFYKYELEKRCREKARELTSNQRKKAVQKKNSRKRK